MRYLGIDYGTKRIGLALSDKDGRMAFPYRTIAAGKRAPEEICALAEKENAEQIVAGVPVPLSGGSSLTAEAAKKFAREIERACKKPVALSNEFFTTKMAQQSGVAKEHRDASAAAIMLQSYLDTINHKT